MKIKHKDYLEYEIPDNWIIEENEDTVSIYCNEGEGALTISFFSIIELYKTLDEHISMMAKKFIDRNQIKLDHAPILYKTKNDKTVLYGVGSSKNGWFVKLWFIARYPKVVFATYDSEKKTSELKKVEKIISSFTFI